MGLDMYLEKEIFVGGQYEHRGVSGKLEYTSNNKHYSIPAKRISFVCLPMGYWRKANAIHKWFVDNVQNEEDDCKKHYVSLEDLKELKTLCKEVLEDHNKAEELLPSKSGFFFGGTDYDEYYFKDLEDTIKIVDYCLEDELNYSGDFWYQSSW